MKFLVLFSLLFVLFSCVMENEIDYATYYKGDRIVVNGFVNPQKGVTAFVKKTLSSDNINGNDKLSDIKVFLYENDVKLFQLHTEDSYYFHSPNSFSVNIEKEYHITVQSKSLQDVYSKKQQIPNPIPIDSLKLEKEDYEPSFLHFYYTNLSIDLGFYVQIYEYQGGVPVDSLDYSENLFDPYSLITNKTTGVKNYKYRFSKDSDSLKIKFFTLSPDIVKFCNSYQEYDWTSEDPYYNHINPVFTNIYGGYGLFASYTFETRTIINE